MKALDVTEFATAWCANEVSLEQLADEYGTTVTAIRAVARNLGLPRRGNGTRGKALTAGRWIFDQRRRIHVWTPGLEKFPHHRKDRHP